MTSETNPTGERTECVCMNCPGSADISGSLFFACVHSMQSLRIEPVLVENTWWKTKKSGGWANLSSSCRLGSGMPT